MILQALQKLYLRLAADPAIDIAPIGFSRQKISFCVVINEDGTLHDVVEETDGNQKRPRPKSLIVPGGAKPPGAGINPCLLWDNTGYLLGFKPDDDKPERTREAFEAFREKHLSLESEIEDPEFAAVCRFLSAWDAEKATDHPTLTTITSGFGVFRVRGRTGYVHERPAVAEWWGRQLARPTAGAAAEGQCLLTGELASLARLHEPKIKGVAGAQSAGASIVSFNDKAYESFGREQSFNAPVSEPAAFQYCTALNYLLREGGPKLRIGDATVVCWTEAPSRMEEFFQVIADPAAAPAEDDAAKQQLQTTLRRISDGAHVDELDLGDPETPFYVLGLSPNAARLSVRFWYVSTLAELVGALRSHFNDLRIVRGFERDPEFPAIWQLLRETVRDSKDIPPLLGGAVMRAVLTGAPYPQMLFSAVIRRIRTDRTINSVRAGILKACLNRNSRFGTSTLPQEIDMSLDPERPEPAYQLGRLFAVLEKAQEDALPGLNATVKDRFFGAASATPASVFPRIIRGSQHHLGKLDYGAKVHREKQIQAICGKIDSFPSHLNLEAQGLFALGYYHQRQAFFTSKRQESQPEAPASA